MWMFSLKSALSKCSKSVSFSSFMVFKHFFTQFSPKFFRRRSLVGQLFKKYIDQFCTTFLTHTPGQIGNVGVTSFYLDSYLVSYRWCWVYSRIIPEGHPLFFPGHFISDFLTREFPTGLFSQIYPPHCIRLIFLKYRHSHIIFLL